MIGIALASLVTVLVTNVVPSVLRIVQAVPLRLLSVVPSTIVVKLCPDAVSSTSLTSVVRTASAIASLVGMFKFVLAVNVLAAAAHTSDGTWVENPVALKSLAGVVRVLAALVQTASAMASLVEILVVKVLVATDHISLAT